MVLKRCKHCGIEGDDSIVAITHKSNCKSRGNDSSYEIIGTSKPAAKVTVASKVESPKPKSKSKTGRR
jgi:hypothetical protein